MKAFHVMVFVGALNVATLGCNHSQAPENPAPAATAESVAAVTDTLTLEVQNHNWSDIVIFVVHDGATTRLTQITANKDESTPIPPYLVGTVGTLALNVRRIGGNDSFTSSSLSVRNGNTIRLTIESRLSKSSVAVW